VVAHAGVVSAIIASLTIDRLDGLLAGADVKLEDATLDRIDEHRTAGIDIVPLEGAAYVPPAIKQVQLRRRPANERAAV
jgi:hypothetical protein